MDIQYLISLVEDLIMGELVTRLLHRTRAATVLGTTAGLWYLNFVNIHLAFPLSSSSPEQP
jgi:hypothetical protein